MSRYNFALYMLYIKCLIVMRASHVCTGAKVSLEKVNNYIV